MAREFSKVGVVGLGTMGAGIAEVLRAQRARRRRRRDGRGRGGARPRAHRALHRPGGQARQAHRGRAAGALRPDRVHHLAGRPQGRRPGRSRRCPSSSTSSSRSSPSWTGSARRTRSWPPTPRRCRSPRSRWPPTGPGKVVGLHFFNPAPVMKLVEVVRTVVTEPTSSPTSRRCAQRLGKVDVTIGDKAGFIANALLFGYLNHAVSMYESRYATREDIDAAMRLGCGLPMGPLALLDLIGLDTAYEILDTMYRQSRDRLHAPGADPQADGHRRAARPEDRPRLLHLRGAGLARRSSPTPLTPAEGGAPRAPAPVRTVGVVGSGTMATGIVEVFAKAGYDVTSWPAARRRSAEVRARGRALAGQGGGARQARPRPTGTPRSPGSPGRDQLDELADVRPGGRGGGRGAVASSRRCSPPSTRSASRARCSPPPRPACR